MNYKNFVRNYFIPIISIPFISGLILIPFNFDNATEIITSVIPVMWIILTFLYLINYLLCSIFLKKGLYKSLFSLALAYLVVGGLFRILHWPGGNISLYTGLMLGLIGVIAILKGELNNSKI